MKKQNLSQQTAQRLCDMITGEKTFAPGEKLPNELDLSRLLGVSRATLREAIQSLSVQGFLEVRRGRGTFVSERAEELAGPGFSALERVRGQLRDLFELRAIFEPRAAALACNRAGEEELENILRLGREVETCIRQNRDRTQADRAFHAAIVSAAHNEFMSRLLPIIDQAVETAVASEAPRERLAQATLQDHALLMEFLGKRDGEGAEHAMAIHMRHAMDEMGLEQ